MLKLREKNGVAKIPVYIFVKKTYVDLTSRVFVLGKYVLNVLGVLFRGKKGTQYRFCIFPKLSYQNEIELPLISSLSRNWQIGLRSSFVQNLTIWIFY